jgi:hypothetical protein
MSSINGVHVLIAAALFLAMWWLVGKLAGKI